jgi:nicotinate-nucleotide adenylyltransferase
VAPPVAAPQQRLAMLKLGIQRIPHFSLLDWEIKQEGPSYTIDTIKRLKEESEADLFLLLGEDQLPHLHQWKDVQKLFSLCAPLIASREGSPLHLPHLLPTVNALVDRGRTKIPIMEISSTLVRMRLAKKQFCGHLVPDLILDYIAQHRLY